MLMSLSKSIMASLTTISEDASNLNFNYCRDQLTVPVPSIALTMYRTIFNTYYAMIPYLRDVITPLIVDEAVVKISYFQSTPIYWVAIVLVLINVGAFMSSVFMQGKIDKALQISYSLFEEIKIDQI